ncbi:MAG: inositol monophosphatase family protein [Alphaproteobacteria bacterium]|nr:inositol monophosphatase family protein [Alphaproteobacteria bacterium]
MQDIKTYIAFAHLLADAAGRAIRPHFERVGTVETKADNSPVTEADKAAESAMRGLIEQEFPDHAIFGEEFGISVSGTLRSISEPLAAGASGVRPPYTQNYTWVIDPIDGTRAFVEGLKEWGTLVALCSDGVPILGILDQPVTGERWVATRGGVSYCSGNVLKTRTIKKLADAEFSTTSLRYFTPEQGAKVAKLAQSCRRTVKDGDCYAYGLLARGARDVVVDAGLKPYDILALVPIIEAAGGVITTWEGKPVTLSDYANVVAAGDKTLHKQALALLQSA